jgi:hypothetical protein
MLQACPTAVVVLFAPWRCPVSTGTLLEARAGYRNFNLCPHCVLQGRQAILCRLCEGIPMISRSDGNLFHLLLADRPIPYPAESKSDASEKLRPVSGIHMFRS